MKFTLWIAGSAIAASLALSLSVLGDGPQTVLQVTASLSGVAQDDINGTPTAAKVKVGGGQLVNLALGRDPGSTPSPNEILALASECGPDGEVRLIVFNTANATVLATIAIATDVTVVTSAKGTQFVMIMEVQEVGDSDNGFNGGTLVLAGSFTVDPSLCLTKASATVVGALNVTFTDDVDTQTAAVLIPKGKLATGTMLGTLSE